MAFVKKHLTPSPASRTTSSPMQAIDEKLFRTMVNSIEDYAMVITDPDGLIISWNKGAEITYGYKENEIIGRHIAFLYTPEAVEKEEPNKNLKEAIKYTTYNTEGWRVRNKGIRFWADVHYTPLYDEKRRLLGYAKVTREVANLKAAAEPDKSLEKKKQNLFAGNISFRKIIENSYEGITLFDKDLNIIYRSPSAERINGWNLAARKDLKIANVVHKDDQQAVNELLNEVKRGPGQPKTCSFRTKHFAGHYIWLECVYTNFLDDPDINAIVCNFRDISEQKQADELLQQTIKELFAYKYALDESAIVAITDQKGIIQHVNDNFCKISKYSANELIGQDHRIINSGYHDKAFIRQLWATIAKGDIWKGELKNKAKDGSFYWVDTTIVPFLNEKGKPYQYIAIRSDITERKLSQEKIIESELFIKTITDNLPALIAYWDADLNCLFANKPYCNWFEKEPVEMTGINKRVLISADEFKQYEPYFKGVLNGLPQSFERSFVKSDGTKMYTHTQYLPDKADVRVKGFYSLIYDITEIKLAEQEINKKTELIENLLENITDGFVSTDEYMNYTYANKKIGEMIGLPPASLIGKNMWEVFPDAVGSATYNGIQTALKEQRYVCNEDHYEPLNLWQENRIYPSGGGISLFIRDITETKKSEQQIKQLNDRFNLISKATNDALFEWNFEKQEIWWSESHFTMFGFDAKLPIPPREEWLAKIHQDSQPVITGILSDVLEKGINSWAHEIKYFKPDQTSGTLLSRGFVIRNEQQKAIRMLGSYIDITGRKNEEQQKALLADIGLIFNENPELNKALQKLLELLVNFGNFNVAEAWLIGSDKRKINLVSKFYKTDEMQAFYDESADVKSFVKGQGFPGLTWKAQAIQFWRNVDENENFLRRKAAKKTGLKTIYGLPLQYNKEIIGVLLLGLNVDNKQDATFTTLFENFSSQLGAEIKRKQLEQELNQVFDFAPDIICIAGIDGYFKKINPAMPALLEYTELELLTRPYIEFVHPDDRGLTVTETGNIVSGIPELYFENRYVTRSGKIKWLAWTSTAASEEGLLFCVAKDITDKKGLEELLGKATSLARIGAWEVDLKKGIVHWSDITREIHETEPSFEPDLEAASNFYKEGENRETIIQCMNEAVKNGTSCDVELQIITAKGNVKWVRAIVETEFAAGKCVKLYGSFQDIDARKKAEIASMLALEEKNTILESIDDGFFAVDKNWVITYWNRAAEKLTNIPAATILNHNMWEVLPDPLETESYKQYHRAMETNQAVRFEEYYWPVEMWYEISVYPSEAGLSVYFRDITGKKKAEASAREALEERNTILESIDDAFFAVDRNWVVTYWNNTAEKVLSVTKEQILNHNLWEIFSGSVESESYKKYHDAIETNQAAHFEDYFAPLNKWYEISAYPSESGLAVYFKDVSERKISDTKLMELNESLQKQAKELSISNAELEQFAYVASHDLQEPLRMVTSFLTQLEKKYGATIDDKGKQYIHFAVDGAKRMREIILDLLEFSVIGNADDGLEDVDLNKLIEEITALHRKQIEETKASIKFENLPIVNSYKSPMRQVFQNLISNSLKYHKAGTAPEIKISCEEKANCWQFSVSDNGIGIEAEYFDKIFIIFQRLHNKNEYSGNGMGLAITKKIIENLGGKIWLASEENQGATFYFTLLKVNKS